MLSRIKRGIMSINYEIKSNHFANYMIYVERGVDINKKHPYGESETYPALTAVSFGRQDILQDMIQNRGVDLTVKKDKKSLIWYSDKREISELLFLNSEINLEERNKLGQTVFMRKIRNAIFGDKDSLDNVEYLLEKGSDINVQDNEGNTPLHKALGFAEDNHDRNRNQAILQVVDFLLKKGSDFDRKNSAGITPEDMLEDINNPDVEQLVTNHIKTVKAKISVFNKYAEKNLNQDVSDIIGAHVIGSNKDSYLQKIEQERAQAAGKDDGKGR
jgi:hypothetical protein